MILSIVSFFVTLVIATMIGIPMGAILATFRAYLTGRYLNRYYIVSKKAAEGVYELHHQPAFGFYFTNNRKFYLLTMDAIKTFQERFPDATLIMTTLTQQSEKRKGTKVESGRFALIGGRLMSDFLILCNLAVYRKLNGKWVVAKLIREVHRNKVMRYSVAGED